MLTQALMFAAIWSKVQCENPERVESSHVFISPFTWVLIILAFLIPIVGTFTFFITNYYWVQEYPVDFMINFLSSLKKTSIFDIQRKACESSYSIAELIGKVRIQLVNRGFCEKFFYPFLDPWLVSLCMGYNFLMASFTAMYFAGMYDPETQWPSDRLPRTYKVCSLIVF